jgi:hypothetical protein
MSCTSGSIGIGNISYNVSSGSYDTMSEKKMSTALQTEAGFDLDVEE